MLDINLPTGSFEIVYVKNYGKKVFQTYKSRGRSFIEKLKSIPISSGKEQHLFLVL
jgi:hypothetical protein